MKKMDHKTVMEMDGLYLVLKDLDKKISACKVNKRARVTIFDRDTQMFSGPCDFELKFDVNIAAIKRHALEDLQTSRDDIAAKLKRYGFDATPEVIKPNAEED